MVHGTVREDGAEQYRISTSSKARRAHDTVGAASNPRTPRRTRMTRSTRATRCTTTTRDDHCAVRRRAFKPVASTAQGPAAQRICPTPCARTASSSTGYRRPQAHVARGAGRRRRALGPSRVVTHDAARESRVTYRRRDGADEYKCSPCHASAWHNSSDSCRVRTGRRIRRSAARTGRTMAANLEDPPCRQRTARPMGSRATRDGKERRTGPAGASRLAAVQRR
jgi:hypothetical protein